MATRTRKNERQLPKLTGDFMVFENKSGFSTTISQKVQDVQSGEDEYINMFVPISFRKEDEKQLEHGTLIRISDGFLSFFTTRKDEDVVKIVALDFEILESPQDKKSRR